jgi:hypothetical protein
MSSRCWVIRMSLGYGPMRWPSDSPLPGRAERFSSRGSLVSLIIYVAFLVYSGTLASYYLFAAKATRIRLA